MTDRSLELDLLPGLFAIAKLPPGAGVPSWAIGHPLSSITNTEAELSIVCPDEAVPTDVVAERGFGCIKVQGPLAFSETGVLASLALPLAEAGISIFVLSTFQTDYLFVQQEVLSEARDVLQGCGHVVHA